MKQFNNPVSLTNFADVLLNEVKSAINSYYSRENILNCVGFSLYSDESVMGVSIAVNTEEYLDKCILEDEGNSEFYKWEVSEWLHETIEVSKGLDTDYLSLANGFLLENSLIQSNDKFENWKQTIYCSCLDVLMRLRDEKLFPENCVFVFSVSDVELMEEWISPFNCKESVKRFIEWREEYDPVE